MFNYHYKEKEVTEEKKVTENASDNPESGFPPIPYFMRKIEQRKEDERAKGKQRIRLEKLHLQVCEQYPNYSSLLNKIFEVLHKKKSFVLGSFFQYMLKNENQANSNIKSFMRSLETIKQKEDPFESFAFCEFCYNLVGDFELKPLDLIDQEISESKEEQSDPSSSPSDDIPIIQPFGMGS